MPALGVMLRAGFASDPIGMVSSGESRSCHAPRQFGDKSLSALADVSVAVEAEIGSASEGTVMTHYEYKFVRIGEYGGSSLFGVRDKDRKGYEHIVHDHAKDGWRLVQIFAPGVAAFGAARYYEFIFEREIAEGATEQAA